MSLALLFGICFQLGLFSFGGGYTMFSLLEDTFVTKLGALSHESFASGVGLSFLAPGPVAKVALFVGYSAAGWGGALIAMLACFGGPVTLATIATSHFSRIEEAPIVRSALRGIAAAAVGVVFVAAFRLSKGLMPDLSPESLLSAAIALVTAVAVIRYKVEPLPIILASAAGGALIALVQ
jgi:chromate transporter